jgi:hypothetical protein
MAAKRLPFFIASLFNQKMGFGHTDQNPFSYQVFLFRIELEIFLQNFWSNSS